MLGGISLRAKWIAKSFTLDGNIYYSCQGQQAFKTEIRQVYAFLSFVYLPISLGHVRVNSELAIYYNILF